VIDQRKSGDFSSTGVERDEGNSEATLCNPVLDYSMAGFMMGKTIGGRQCH
jgi:hypothetical protein